MFLEERISYMMNKLSKYGRVNVSELSKELGVSEVTIRKDLKVLEDKGYLKRTFGGAVLLKHHIRPASLSEKKVENIQNKKLIAEKASEFLSDGMDIFLDSGTTTFEIIPKIVKLKNMRVVTYDLQIALELSKFPETKTYILGGYLDSATQVSVGTDGIQTLFGMHADICFIGTDGFDENFVYSTDEVKSKLKRIMIDNSKFRVLVTDSSKFMNQGFYSFYKLKDFDSVLTDRENQDLNKILDEGI